MEIVKFRGVRTPKPMNRLTKNLARVITSAMTPRMPKFKTIALLGAWRRMREILPSRCFFFARDEIYTSRAYAKMSVSVCLSVCL